MTTDAICPCESFEHPRLIFNASGRRVLDYRVGDFNSFRQALLLARPGEIELKNWRPSARGDLALQLIEWWAYLADILTFYNERIAYQSYLRTADQPESLKALIRLLGYRPRPGIGARGVLAALSSSPKPFTLPAGFQVQSKPGPGKQPQVFELDAATTVQPIGAVAADAPPAPALLNGSSVLLKGAITTIKSGDQVLLLSRTWAGTATGYALATVQELKQIKDPRGKTNTRMTFTAAPALPAGAGAKDYRLLKSTGFIGLWPYPTGTHSVINAARAHLAAIVRQIKPGDPVLLTGAASLAPQLIKISKIREDVWYANPGSPNNPADPPNPEDEPPVPIPHTRLSFQEAPSGAWDANRETVQVQFAWQDVGELIEAPAASASLGGVAATLNASGSTPFPVGSQPVLIEDAIGDGLLAMGAVGAGSPTSIQLTDLPDPAVPLQSPLHAFFNLLNVSQGKTVPNEVLGSGDATLAGQEFVLKKSPLTYLLDPSSTSGESYASTLQVWVEGVEWQEAPSFYGQPPEAKVFVTREDAEDKAHVLFGDGVNGARLPSGLNNVVAAYRYGSGADAPDAGTLNVILKPYPGLKAIRNPVPPAGGADPDPPEQIRRYAPQSVLTFGRAVSGDDYETIAAQAPGVARARAYWAWDSAQQRTLVTVYVGDDSGAITAAKAALAKAVDPNRPVKVLQAAPVPIRLSLTVQVDPTRLADDVLAGVRATLLDKETGLFGLSAVRIGKRVYNSELYAACLSVPGAVAVHGLAFVRNLGNWLIAEAGRWHDPGQGKFYQLAPEDLTVTAETLTNVS